MQMIDKYVEAHTGYQGMEVTADGVICKDSDGNEVLVPGKSVICAVGQRANRSAVDVHPQTAPQLSAKSATASVQVTSQMQFIWDTMRD